MAGVARGRLAEERKSWRKNHPHGFQAKPDIRPDGSVDLLFWKCAIPGMPGTIWEGGLFPVTLQFNDDYPSKPPICRFPKGFIHPNVYPSGMICLSILSESQDWQPSITVTQILLGIQDLLDKPNPDSPANHEINKLFSKDVDEYRRKVIEQAEEYRPHDD